MWAGWCRSPAALLAVVAAVVGAGATLYDYHKALEFVGVYGLLVTAVLRYNSFKVRMTRNSCLFCLRALCAQPLPPGPSGSNKMYEPVRMAQAAPV